MKLQEIENKIDELMKSVKDEVESLDANNYPEDWVRGKWQDLHDQLDQAHSMIIFDLPNAIQWADKQKEQLEKEEI